MQLLFSTELIPLHDNWWRRGVREGGGGAVWPLQLGGVTGGVAGGQGEVEGEGELGEVGEQGAGVGGTQEARAVPDGETGQY